jgi:hypothetical protein
LSKKPKYQQVVEKVGVTLQRQINKEKVFTSIRVLILKHYGRKESNNKEGC